MGGVGVNPGLVVGEEPVVVVEGWVCIYVTLYQNQSRGLRGGGGVVREGGGVVGGGGGMVGGGGVVMDGR